MKTAMKYSNMSVETGGSPPSDREVWENQLIASGGTRANMQGGCAVVGLLSVRHLGADLVISMRMWYNKLET